MIRQLFSAAFAIGVIAGPVSAATFNMTVVNVQDMNRADSEATMANFNDALNGVNGTNLQFDDDWTYTGDLNFGTPTVGQTGTTTIGSWLASAPGGSVVDLDPTVAGLRQSRGNIDATPTGTAITTFYMFEMTLAAGTYDLSIRHDDGVAVFNNGSFVGGFNGPNTARTTAVNGVTGGSFQLLYVATNNDPSILRVTAAPGSNPLTAVPVPATLPLLLAGFGGLALMRRRAKAS